MLHDKANWPTINLPPTEALQYPPHMIARQQAAAAAVAQMQVGPSPMKHIPDRDQHRRGPSNTLEPTTIEEEEDVSRGDMLDFMTPRDISRIRYEQHHEWMEEIMSSPFAMKQILPTDLGLGRKGDLEALTGGFFDTPTSTLQEISPNAPSVRIGRMEITKAEEFTGKAAKKVADMKAELAILKRRHAKRLAKLDSSSFLITAEKRLRTAAVEGDSQDIFENNEAGSGQRARVKVNDIVHDVETGIGKKIVPVSLVECVQKGGLEEKIQAARGVTPKVHLSPGKALNESHTNSSNSEALGAITKLSHNVQQQQQSVAGIPPPSQAGKTSHGHEIQRSVAVDVHMNEPPLPSLDDMDVDVAMVGQHNAEQTLRTDNDGSEWVMVDNMNAGSTKEDLRVGGRAQHELTHHTTEAAGTTAASGYADTATGGGIHNLAPAEPSGEGVGETEGMNTDDFDLGPGEFDTNLDDGGHGLIDFGDEHGDLDLEGMDDSAFGNAFHPPDESEGHLPGHGDIS